MPRLRLLLVVVLGLLAFAPAASAASRSQIFSDCEDDSKLSGTYSPRDLRDARNNLPSDRDAYSDCRDVLSAALAAGARRSADASTGSPAGGGAPSPSATAGAGAGAGATQASPYDGAAAAGTLGTAPGAAPPRISAGERNELRTARENLPEVDIHGQRVVPGVRSVAGDAASATIPGSLLATLVLLGVILALASALFVRRRVLARRAA